LKTPQAPGLILVNCSGSPSGSPAFNPGGKPKSIGIVKTFKFSSIAILEIKRRKQFIPKLEARFIHNKKITKEAAFQFGNIK
jgi:hypothetical protein